MMLWGMTAVLNAFMGSTWRLINFINLEKKGGGKKTAL